MDNDNYKLTEKGMVICAVIFGKFQSASRIAERCHLDVLKVESYIKELLDDGDLDLDGETLIPGDKWNV